MSWITVVTFDSERPVKSSKEGEPAARVRAVAAPIPPFEGPVMTTGFYISVCKEDEAR